MISFDRMQLHMSDAIEYLQDYVDDPRLLTADSVDESLLTSLPEWWRNLLTVDGPARVRRVIERWEEQRIHLPAVVDFLEAHLRKVELLSDKFTTRLLYELEKDGDTMYYCGGNPLQKSMKSSVQAIWSRLPQDFTRFYDSFHNGWYYLASNSMGPSPVEDFFLLDELEWGLLDNTGDPGCNLHDLLAIYTNGMGAYVAISVEEKGDVLWWNDKPPTLNINAWAVIDEWTTIGFQE